MQKDKMNFNPELLREMSLVAFVLTFLGGVVTSIGPCNIATIPLIVGYKDHYPESRKNPINQHRR